MKLYPIMINVDSKVVVVVGGGDVATRKISDLLDTDAFIRVIAPDFSYEIMDFRVNYPDRVILIRRDYRKGDLKNAVLVFTTTDNPAVNSMVFEEANEKKIFANSADDPLNCSFHVPSFTRRGNLIVSLSTGGLSPAIAARLRREMEKHIPEDVDIILDKLGAARHLLKEDEVFDDYNSRQRGEILKRIAGDDLLLDKLISCADNGEIKTFLLEL